MTTSVPGPSYLQSFRYFHKAVKIGFLEMLTALQQTYGDLVKLQTPNGRTLYLVNAPSDIQSILQTHSGNFIKGKSVAPFKLLVGNSLPVSDGEEWRNQRRVLQPAFHRPKLASYIPQIVKTTEEHIDLWEKNADEFDIVQAASRLTHDIVARSLFGTELGNSLFTLQKAWDEALKFTYEELHELIKLPLSIPTPRNRKFKRALATVSESADRIIQSRVAQKTDSGDDLLSRLIQSRRRGEETAFFTDIEIRNQILAFLFAGHETTASNIAWTIYLILNHPLVEEKLRAELAAITENGNPTLDQLSNLSYLKNVIFESLRLYPPAAVFVREAIKEIEINGKVIKKGGIVLISPYIFHRRGDIWDNPLHFNPDRFNDETLRRPGAPRFIAFGYGSRACIGEHFATIEAEIILMTLLRRMKMKLASKLDPKPVFVGTMAPDKILVNMKSFN